MLMGSLSDISDRKTCKRFSFVQLCNSKMIKTVVQVDRRGKRLQRPGHVCVADVRHGLAKCAGQSAVDFETEF
jgi:hypothetical protein